MKAFIVILVLIVAVAGGLGWHFRSIPVPQNKVLGSVALWQQTVDREIPLGTAEKDIVAWSHQNDIALFKMGDVGLHGLIKTFTGGGIGFPCSRWNIVLEIRMGSDKKSTWQKVRASDGCK